jgi:hypothetical protein
VTSPDLWPDPPKLSMPFSTLSDVFPYCPTFFLTVRRFPLLSDVFPYCPTFFPTSYLSLRTSAHLLEPPLTFPHLCPSSCTFGHFPAPPTSALCAPTFSLKAPALCMFRTISLSCRMLRTLNPMMLHAFHLHSTPFPLCPIQFPSHLSSMYVLDI